MLDPSADPSDAVTRATLPGAWTWDIADDILTGNGQLASLFGLHEQHVRIGLPLASFIDNIHPEDRVLVLEALSASIEGCGFYAMQYRICRAREELHVQALGRCFPKRNGPRSKLHVGVVFDISGFIGRAERDLEDCDLDRLANHCVSAQALAERQRYAGISQAMRFILDEIGNRISHRA